MKNLARSLVWCLLLLGAAAVFNGCASDDPGNTAARPWNTPAGWGGALPSNINQGR